eukprot:CFRG5338T1
MGKIKKSTRKFAQRNAKLKTASEHRAKPASGDSRTQRKIHAGMGRAAQKTRRASASAKARAANENVEIDDKEDKDERLAKVPKQNEALTHPFTMAGTEEEMQLDAGVEEKLLKTAKDMSSAAFLKKCVASSVEDIPNVYSYIGKVMAICGMNEPTGDIREILAELKSALLAHLSIPETRLAKRGNCVRNCSKWSHDIEKLICACIIELMKVPEKLEGPIAASFLLSVRDMMHFVGACEDLPKWVLKRALFLVANHGDQLVREAAYLVIRDLALLVPFPFVNLCTRGLYWTYVSTCTRLDKLTVTLDEVSEDKDSKMTTLVQLYETEKRMQMLSQCVIECMAIDPNSAYTCGFVYMRDLAISVSTAMTNIDDHNEWANTSDVIDANDKAKEAKRMALVRVTSWAHLSQLRLWTKALVGASGIIDDEAKIVLAPLAYPLIQVIANSMNVIDNSDSYRTAPFRLHLAELLLTIKESGCVNVGTKSGVHVSIGFALTPLLRYGSDTIVKKSSQNAKNTIHVTVKQAKSSLNALAVIPTSWMNSRDAKTAVVEAAVGLIARYVGIVGKCVSFPEETMVITHVLRQFAGGGGRWGDTNVENGGQMKSNEKNSRVVKLVQSLLSAIEKHTSTVELMRNRLQTGPRNGRLMFPNSAMPNSGVFAITKVCDDIVSKLSS